MTSQSHLFTYTCKRYHEMMIGADQKAAYHRMLMQDTVNEANILARIAFDSIAHFSSSLRIPMGFPRNKLFGVTNSSQMVSPAFSIILAHRPGGLYSITNEDDKILRNLLINGIETGQISNKLYARVRDW